MQKRNCLEGESNSHLRITQGVLGHIRYETSVLTVILSRLDVICFDVSKYIALNSDESVKLTMGSTF
jgi:hypothetical protein